MVSIKRTFLLSILSQTSSHYPNQTKYCVLIYFLLNFLVSPKDNFKAKPGPSLIQARAYHCSAVMEINGENHIVVAGGDISLSNSQRSVYLDSVELLNPLSGKGWQKGKLPKNRFILYNLLTQIFGDVKKCQKTYISSPVQDRSRILI